MVPTNQQEELGVSNQVSDPAKSRSQISKDIEDFHESLEAERVHRVLLRWRKRKRDDELSNGTAILEKILRTLHEEFEERKERAELWDQALIAELKTEKARRELEGRAAASALSPEKQTRLVHAIASVLNIEVSSEEVGKMLSKTTAVTGSVAKSLKSTPPTPPADQRSPVSPRNAGSPHHVRESESRTLESAPRTPGLLSRTDSQAGSRDDYTAYQQGLRPKAPGKVSRQPLLLRKMYPANILMQDQITNTDRNGRSMLLDAADQEAESRRPIGLEIKRSREEIHSPGSEYSRVRLKEVRPENI